MSRHQRWAGAVAAASVLALLAGGRDAQAQAAKAAQTVTVALTVAGTVVKASGPGECVSSNAASLYDVPGTMWNVRHEGTDVNFTLWRLSKGGDGVTLFVDVAGKTHRVNTAPAGPAANRRGSGTATFTAKGSGGTFTLNLVADTGAAITGQISCPAFGTPEDNGR
jgi:uncharacterized membrane protein